MVFSSLVFLFLFLPLCVGLYFAMPGIKAKNVILTILSLVFYAWGEPVWVVLLLFSSLQDYTCGRVIDRYRGRWQAKAALLVSLVVNFSLLGFFKYIDFFFSNANLLLHTNLPMLNLALPIGISFYTFQTVSYTIDLYKNKVQVQKNFFDFLLFVSLFTQLVAGPILRYSDVADQIQHRTHSWNKAAYGATRFAVGLAKKVMLANYFAQLADSLLADPSVALARLPVVDAWLVVLAYTLQIYFDFSGYSDMAIGLGHVFGFQYPENFRYPYAATSITEFWRRWHISLSSFFRDYVYIPMGGNRRHQLLNLFVVWFLTGLWHGAAWNFVAWGLYYFVLLCLEKFVIFKITKKIKAPAWLGKTIGWLYTFVCVMIGWVLFYTPNPTEFVKLGIDVKDPLFNLTRSADLLKAMFGLGGNALTDGLATTTRLTNHALMLLVAFVAFTPLLANISRKRYNEKTQEGAVAKPTLGIARLAFIGVVLLLCVAQLVGSSYNPFIYFNF